MENGMPTTEPTHSTPPVTPAPPAGPTGPTPAGSGGAGEHKAMAIIGYIIPLLFFIPLISDAKNNSFAKFHANQQLNLLLFWVAINVIMIIPVLGWIIYPIGVVAGIVFMIMGIMNAANEKQKELPLIGKYSLLS